MVKRPAKGSPKADDDSRTAVPAKTFRCPFYAIVLLVGAGAYSLFRSGGRIDPSFYLPKDYSSSMAGLSTIISSNTTSSSCIPYYCDKNGRSQNTDTSTITTITRPTCRSMMENRNSPYRDGSFLTRHTIPIIWHPIVDGSRELQHSMCQLHRYSAVEARQCLAGKHINFIGDSLTRYQFLSLTWFLHKGRYPPHFGRTASSSSGSNGGPPPVCPHVDENGQETCSPFDQPNVCLENDWRGDIGDGETKYKYTWVKSMQAVGGRYFDGYMESNGIRNEKTMDQHIVENYFYVTPLEGATTTAAGAHSNNKQQQQVYVSYNNEIGWHDQPEPIRGFQYTACAYSGSCKLTDEMVEQRLQRAMNSTFDWSQPLETAIAPEGILRRVLPPVNITLYNRGIWGALQKERVERLMPLLHNYSQGNHGRCYFQSTTGRFDWTLQAERTYVKEVTQQAGCGYIDLAHLVEDFNQLVNRFPPAPDQEYGNVQDERHFVYMDKVHFQPWVYEELNNMLLNVLCNNA